MGALSNRGIKSHASRLFDVRLYKEDDRNQVNSYKMGGLPLCSTELKNVSA